MLTNALCSHFSSTFSTNKHTHMQCNIDIYPCYSWMGLHQCDPPTCGESNWKTLIQIYFNSQDLLPSYTSNKISTKAVSLKYGVVIRLHGVYVCYMPRVTVCLILPIFLSNRQYR